MILSRRGVVASLIAGAAAGARAASPSASPLVLGAPRPFSFDELDQQARRAASRPYQPARAPAALEQLNFDAMGQIRFRPEAALWKGDSRFGEVQFFHPSRYARTPVAVHTVEDGQAREIRYSRALFDIPAGSPALRLPEAAGFAGFRVMNPAAPGDWIAYQGASYFRAADPFNQYGLSARGLAVDTAIDGPEEFPVFTAFWLERAADELVVYALLDGPSVAGAYRIGHRRGPEGLTQAIEARLHFRGPVRRLGIAPLTSMYWYGRDGRPSDADWRPQIHDSDGLSMWTGKGERIWRPLANPPRVTVNAFQDADPKGFGLMQRDRAFADYEDDGAFYDKRPSVWVEPEGNWGEGSVQLVELPTRDETEDNIVAFWTPKAPATAGQALGVRYRLHWAAAEPVSPGVALVTATREGRGGRPGQPLVPGARKYVVDFAGGRLAELNRQSGVVPVVEISDGRIIDPATYPIVGTKSWRLMFDVEAPTGRTLDLRAYLRLGGGALTETWIDQIYT
jgi:glucans biosynthesis protein